MPAIGAGGVSGEERPARDPALTAEGLGRRLGEAWIWRGISFALAAGKNLAVTGPTGSGKTLLLRALAGLDGFEEGRVLVSGEAAEALAPQRLRARVSYLHQRPALLEGSVLDNLVRPFRLTIHRHREFDRHRALELLSGLGRDEAFLAFPAGELSGGEQQVVALVRALQLDPQVLLLDEPSASLDNQTAGAVEDLVTGWVRQGDGRACVWTSHDQAQLGRVADQRLALPRGEP